MAHSARLTVGGMRGRIEGKEDEAAVARESERGVRPEAAGRKPAASACERRRFRRAVSRYG